MRKLCLCVLVFQILPLTAFSATWTVRPDGTGDFPNIQAAVNGSVNGDIIILTDGFFNNTGDHGVNYFGKAITIRSANGPNSTTINCLGDDGFIFANNEPTGSVLRDVTIQSANTGLMCMSGTPTIRNIVLRAAFIGVQVGVFVGGPASVPSIDSTLFSGCRNGVSTGANGTLHIAHSTITGSQTAYSGNGQIAARNCTFSLNSNGALFSSSSSASGSFDTCSFYDHTGNAVSAAGGTGPVTLSDCTFLRNKAAVFCDQNGVKIERCSFFDNAPAVFADQGHGVLEVYQSVFCGNTFAITCGMGMVIKGNTVVRSSPDFGGAISFFGPDVTGSMERNIVAFGVKGPGISCSGNGPLSFSCNDVFGNAGGNTVCGASGDNFSADPLFCTTGCGAFGLMGASPCAPANSPCGVLIGAAGVECNPLPVLFSSVAATLERGTVHVRWSVDADEGIASFSIVRQQGGKASVVASDLLPTTDEFLDPSTLPTGKYSYVVSARTLDGDVFQSQAAIVSLPQLELVLFQNHPNPFNPSTSLTYTLPERETIDLSVYDVNGVRVATLVSGPQAAGTAVSSWGGRDDRGQAVGSGVYFCKLKTSTGVRTVKMVLLK